MYLNNDDMDDITILLQLSTIDTANKNPVGTETVKWKDIME